MDLNEIVITLPKNRRVDAQVNQHVVHTDQPIENGGENLFPSPFDLFLASLGTCAGIFIQGFCAKRNIDPSGIRLVQKMLQNEAGELGEVQLWIEVPPEFPEQYKNALIQVVEGCSVKKAITRGLVFKTEVAP
jgi:putative redox protein